MHHNRHMGHAARAVITVALAPVFEELLQSLHQCSPNCPTQECPKQRAVLALASIVLDTCVATQKNLRTPHQIPDSLLEIIVKKVVLEIWEEFNLADNPIELGGYTPRNQIIHHRMYVKARAAYRALYNFPGWRS
jgi:hypothetical protein